MTTPAVDEPRLDQEEQSKLDAPVITKKRSRLKLLRSRSKARDVGTYEFTGKDSEVSGIIFLEVRKILDLPPERNGNPSCESVTVERF